MIKHEEAKSFLSLLPAKLKDFYSDYISQQEKKDELLELYRELIYKEETYITSDSFSQKMEIVEQLRELRLEIQALEEELK